MEQIQPWFNSLVLTPVSRWPTRLADETARAVLGRPIPAAPAAMLDALPAVSIIVVTYNNLVFNRLSLEAVLSNTSPASFELVVVDNGSTDGTVEYLRQLASADTRVRIIANGENRGFAAANNQALAVANGEYFVLLNNDTIVPRHWLETLLRPLSDRAVGLIGPVTNRAGNEAEIPTCYQSYGEMLQLAEQNARDHAGEVREVGRLILFCAAMRREVFAEIGLLDERFHFGMFEDDDFSFRMRAAGYRLLLAEDAFVHHFGQASLGKLAATGAYGDLFHANRQRWEAKWDQPWLPYQRRANTAYDKSLEALFALAAQHIAPEDIALIVSKGDQQLTGWHGWRGWHFPQTATGEYAGYHPANCAEAISHLEALRRRGARWLVVPLSSLWWLDHYHEFHRELLARHQLIDSSAVAGKIFRLLPTADAAFAS